LSDFVHGAEIGACEGPFTGVGAEVVLGPAVPLSGDGEGGLAVVAEDVEDLPGAGDIVEIEVVGNGLSGDAELVPDFLAGQVEVEVEFFE